MNKTKLAFLTGLIILVILIYIFFITKPSNNRHWEQGFDKMAAINITNNVVSVNNVRDFHFVPKKIISFGYIDRNVDITKIAKVWFVIEPFTIQPFSFFKGVAHTYFVFDFIDQSPLVISVEARRKVGEKYNAWLGAFNQYELIYIWGTEEDETIRRVILEDNKLYMYPLNISQKGAQRLFLELAQTSQDLEKNPRFYNTLFSNCTNELAKLANKVKKDAVPFNKALFLPGYSTELLYKLGYIPNNAPIEEIKLKYYISDKVREIYDQDDFSRLLRLSLPGN